MLISPFRKPLGWLLLALLVAVFVGLFVGFGVVEANDSYTYLVGSVRVSPLYPVLISIFRALFSETLYLKALIFMQELLSAYAIFSLIEYLWQRFSLHPLAAGLLALGFAGAYVLRLFLVGPEALYCNTILTEAITYPLYFLFVKYVFAAWDTDDYRKLLTAAVIAFLLAVTRGQLICLILVLLAVFLLMLRARSARRGLWIKALLVGLCYGLGILVFSISYHYALIGVASETTMGKETVLGALLYNSDAEDAALFSEEDGGGALLRETLQSGEANGLTYRSAPQDFVGRFKHYEASHDELRACLHTCLTARYEGEMLDDNAMRLVLAGYADGWIPGLLKANGGRYLINCAVNALGGLVRTNSIMRRAGVLWSAVVYALLALCLLIRCKRAALSGERRFLALILIASLINALFCCFGVFELSRYVYYNFPCQYLALSLFGIALIRMKKRRPQP